MHDGPGTLERPEAVWSQRNAHRAVR